MTWFLGPLSLAQEAVIDQSNTNGNRLYAVTPMTRFELPVRAGQSFTPNLDSFNFVDLMIRNVSATGSATFRLYLHEGTIGGVNIGFREVTLNGSPSEWTRFNFGIGRDDFVRLTPTTWYTLELEQLEGSAGWAVLYGETTGYAPGAAYFNGGLTTNDLVFREGVMVPRLNVDPYAGGAVHLAWPTNLDGYFHKYVLESAASLNAPTWSRVTDAVSVDAGYSHVWVQVTNIQRFFRLRKTWEF